MRLIPKEIIQKLKQNNLKIRATARDLGVSPGTVINWKKRATSTLSRLTLRINGLNRKSTRPKTIRATTLTAQEQDAVTMLKKKTHFGAIKIQGILKLSYHHRTIHRFLKAKGLTLKQNWHIRPRLQPTIHMHAKNATAPGYLQMDVKYITPQLSGLPHTVFEYALIDIFSRYKTALIVPNLDSWSSVCVLQALLPDFPVKVKFIQTDNGLEFQREFLLYLEKQGLEHHFIHKSSPNENAVIERSFRTDEDEFFCWHYHPATNLNDLNNQYHQWLKSYNHERPHLSLKLKTPFEVITTGKI
jgi:transposase InsO family protein